MLKQKSKVDLTSTIKAVRNGLERTFTRNVWDFMPPNKEGWEELKETPAELKKTEDKPAVVTEDGIATVYIKIQVRKATEADEDNDELDIHTMRQSDFDEVPGFAEAGFVVGDKLIYIKPETQTPIIPIEGAKAPETKAADIPNIADKVKKDAAAAKIKTGKVADTPASKPETSEQSETKADKPNDAEQSDNAGTQETEKTADEIAADLAKGEQEDGTESK